MRPFLSPLLLFVVVAIVVVVRPLHNARDAAARERKLRFGAVSASVSVSAAVAVSLFFFPHLRDVNSCA